MPCCQRAKWHAAYLCQTAEKFSHRQAGKAPPTAAADRTNETQVQLAAKQIIRYEAYTVKTLKAALGAAFSFCGTAKRNVELFC